MSTNAEIALRFNQIAQMMELLGEDRFRVNAHARAARSIADLTTNLADLADDRKALMEIEGIGAKAADKIIEFCQTGKIAEHEELSDKVPAGLLDVLDVPGLGPKTVKLMWEQLDVESIDDLKRIIDDESILTLPRMGKKTVDNIKASLAFAEKAGERIPIGKAMPLAEAIVAEMAKTKGAKQVEFAGSLRRGRDTIGDIDILMVTTDAEAAREAFCTMKGVEQVIARGETKCSVRLVRDKIAAQADLRILPKESWGAALMYFSGSKQHNVRLRERALKLDLTLNEYGLFPLDDDDTPPQHRGVKAVAGKTEEDIYKALNLSYIPPEVREDRGELNAEFEDLITIDDIVAELHAHTTASDGHLEMSQLVGLAKERGFHTIAVTDHSRSEIQANGLSDERLLAQIEQVRELDTNTKGIKILAGSEVGILADGTLDYDEETLAALDHVVASPHVALKQDTKTCTKRLIKAIEHPAVRILGHPTGRLIGRRPGLEPAMDEIIAAAKQHDVALEINAHWMRLDLRDSHVRAAVDAGALIAINCDVHAEDHFDNLRYGILTARRGWLKPEQCINCWPAKRLHKWLQRP